MQYRIYGEIGIHGAADYPDARRGASSWIFIHPSSSTPSSTLRILPDPTFFYRFVSTFTLASKFMISQKPVHSMKAMNRPYILLFNSYRLHRLCRPASMPGMARAARTVRLTGTACPCSTAGTTGRSCPVEFRQLLLCIFAEVFRNIDFHYCVMTSEFSWIFH